MIYDESMLIFVVFCSKYIGNYSLCFFHSFVPLYYKNVFICHRMKSARNSLIPQKENTIEVLDMEVYKPKLVNPDNI